MRKKIIYIWTVAVAAMLLWVVIFFLATKVLAQENYCHDKASWAEWDQVLQKSPDDLPFKTMYALRIGLCTMVERQQISIENATEVFEVYRQNLMERREREKAANEPKLAL